MSAQPSSGTRDGPLEAGFFLAVVALPLVFAPFTAAPFADIKLLVLTLASLLVAASRPAVDLRVGVTGAAFVFAMALSALLGRDPWWSVLGPENQATGMVALAAGTVLLVSATGAGAVRDRIAGWLFWTGVIVAAVTVIARFVDLGGPGWELGRFSSTLGYYVYIGGFLAAATLAATRLGKLGAREEAGLLVIASGLSVTATRSAWIGAGVGLVVVGTLTWPRWRRPAIVGLITVGVIAGWTVLDRQAPREDLALSAVPRFAELGEGSAQQRVPVWTTNLRAFTERPALGSGPGTGWGGYLENATEETIRRSTRGYGDAHNISVELLATTGAIGTGAALALLLAVLVAIRRPRPDRAWALGAAVALGVVHLLQPLNIVLTPLLFLTIGLATGPPTRPVRLSRWIVLALAIALALAGMRFGASALHSYGRTFASERALQLATRLEPNRMGASLDLARWLVIEHRSGDPEAAKRAQRIFSDLAAHRGWSPAVRLEAANLSVAMDDDAAARAWIAKHLRHFPNDPPALTAAAFLALRGSDEVAAERFARRALDLDPRSLVAKRVLDSLE